MSTPVRRPFGVGFLSILLLIGGVLDVIGGIVVLFQRNDDDLLSAVDATTGDVTTYGTVAIIFGVVAILVAGALRGGQPWARYLVAIIAALRLATIVWAVVAYDNIHWYNAFWPAAVYTLVAGYLFFDKDAKAYFAT